MNNETMKQHKARNVLARRFIKTSLVASLLLSGAMTTIGPSGVGMSFTHMQVAEAASEINVFEDIVSGEGHFLALSTDRSVYAWGFNYYGQIGNTTTHQTTPTKVEGLTNVAAIETGDNHNLALTSEGDVYTWGRNDLGQLGNGKTGTSKYPTPTKVEGLSNVVAVKAGINHSFAITSDGSVFAWGANDKGQLGDGTTTNKLIPTKVNGLSNVAKLEAGRSHSLAVMSDGSVYAWGANDRGQLGDASTINKVTPTKVNSLSNVTEIEVGDSHSIAIISDGSVYAWGLNDKGQIGDGTKINKLIPTKVLSNVIEIEAGANHSLAITSDGTLYAWGHNQYSQLGDRSTTDRTTPLKVNGLSNVTEIVAGTYHSLAITTGGSVYAWGNNGSGQLGNGTTTSKITPMLLVNIKASGGEETKILEAATASVVKAEGSLLQADVEASRLLVNNLPSGTEKTNLTNRLDVVQKAIDDANTLAEQRATATTTVVKAEGSKLQTDVDASRSLVNALPDSEEKTSLINRLNVVQVVIDVSAASYEEAMAELVDMKAYLLTGEGTREDILAMKDALNVILSDSTSLLQESQRTEVAHYVQDVLDIIGLLETIWDKIANGELAGLDELVSQLPESELKDNIKQEVEDAKTPEIDNALVEAVESVEKAEQSKLQADVDASRSLVNGLEDGTEKASLIERLEAVQKGIDDEKLLADQVIKATAAVKKAETSKVQTDIDAARKLVEALPSISEKPALTIRLDSILVSPEGEELVKEAQDAVDKLNDQSTKEQLTTAKELVAKLPTSSTKTDLSDRITKIELNQKAINAVVQAEKMQTNYNITLAEKAINQLPDGPLKTELAERIQQLKLTLEAESKVKSAELTKRDPYITDAMESINKLNDSPKKTELTNRMKVIQDALAGEAEATLLEEATIHVVLAEQHKRDPYLTSAKDLVSKLKEGADKTALEARLKAIQDAAPVTPEAPEVDPALLKAAETQVSYAERYKRDPYLTRAQEAVDKLPTSEVKTVMQERLNVLTNEASDQVEAAKLKTASDRVAKAETASDLFVIEEARSLVNGLKDGDAKQTLSERIEAIEVTELMQFAYELKVEIDAITDVTIKQALQEAYTAVGVAKERQTLTYMTKASKSIEALNKYEATYSNVIEKLSTFFTDMQKELEMQKLIVAADNAVALAEKYKRAPYFVKAQAAIDLVPVGKAKTDLQTRLDVVMN
ncbi:RCC1 domain-containing protein [Psychrobacillus sp. FSL H8-0510]|uniref:RCC1 domain-containing protein n=1 Tax=Psychrobacillus sp. FSL H8-0510 TaxID=2921394 RepID=UPI0030F6CF8A